MDLEIVWESMTPHQSGRLTDKIKNSKIFMINASGHIDVTGKEKLKNFPRRQNHYINIGYIGSLKNSICAVLSNTEYPELKIYHHALRKLYREVMNEYCGFTPKKTRSF